MTGDETALGDKGRLLFGAGFAFGVACALLILVVVVATVTAETARDLLGREVFVTIGAGIFFAGVVGIGLYVLAFPENRLEVPIGRALRAEAAHDGTATDRVAGDDDPAGGDDAGTDDEPNQ